MEPEKPFRALRRFMHYALAYRLLLVAAIVAGLAKFGLNYSFPWLIGTATDYVIEPVREMTDDERLATLRNLVLLGIVLSIAHGIATYYRSYLASLLGNRVIRDLRQDIFDHLHRLSLHFYSRERTGSIISRIITDITQASQIVNGGIISVVMDLFSMVFGLWLLLSIDWRMTIAALFVLPFYVGTFKYLNPRVKKASAAVQEQISRISGNVQEQLAGIALVKSSTAERRERERFREDTEEHYERAVTQRQLAGGVTAVSEGLIHIGQTAVIGVGGILATRGDVTAGEVVKFIGWLAVMYFPVRRFAEINVIVQQSTASIERVFRVFDITPEITDKPDAVDASPERGEVVFENVSFDYDSNNRERLPDSDDVVSRTSTAADQEKEKKEPSIGFWQRLTRRSGANLNGDGDVASSEIRPLHDYTNGKHEKPQTHQKVIDGLSLHVQPGERVAFVGPSGAGKTTVVSLLPRLYDVTGGRILIDGVDIRDYKQRKLRRAIGIVQQDSFLFSGTLRDNLKYGRPGASDEEMIDAAKAANAHEFISQLPEGYDSAVGERGVSLSGGQRQRISIARAILKDPRILILDEATSALDSESERLVQEALDRLMRGRTSLIIAHRLSTVRDADRIFVMQAGQLVEEGTHDELLARGGLYARLCSQQFGAEAVEAVRAG